MPTASSIRRAAAICGVVVPLSAVALTAQNPTAPAAPQPPESVERVWAAARTIFNGVTLSIANRGYLGITPRNSSGPADTLGLLVSEVEDGMPASKAGIARGARLASIDGVDLRVDPRDLGDYAGEALPENRLRRTLERKQPGDTVTLVVLTDGKRETRRVVLGESAMGATMRAMRSGRRVLGVSFSERGSMRDTSGLMIVSVAQGGAADSAGLFEGDRVASINGVDLRVAVSDAGESEAATARVSRFRRTMNAAPDSQPVRLEVISEGKRRTVSVMPKRERGWSFDTDWMQGPGGRVSVNMDGEMRGSESIREFADTQRQLAGTQREVARSRANVQREMARIRIDDQRDRMTFMEGDGERSRDGAARSRMRGIIHGQTDGATLVLSGLSLAAVDRDFAQQFGKGSESGALVVRSRDEWAPLKAGDVILTVEGRGVRDGAALDITFDRGQAQRVEILRNGRKETVTLPSAR